MFLFDDGLVALGGYPERRGWCVVGGSIGQKAKGASCLRCHHNQGFGAVWSKGNATQRNEVSYSRYGPFINIKMLTICQGQIEQWRRIYVYDRAPYCFAGMLTHKVVTVRQQGLALTAEIISWCGEALLASVVSELRSAQKTELDQMVAEKSKGSPRVPSLYLRKDR